MKQKKRRTIRVDGTWDMECAGWDRPVVIVTNSRRTGIAVHHTVGDALALMRGEGGYWWAHNGGAYDTVAAVADAYEDGHTMTISLAGSRVSRAQGGGLTLCDSYGLIPLGLEHVAELAGMESVQLDLECICGTQCGGYCSISVHMGEYRMRKLETYCVSDTEVLSAGLDALIGLAEQHDYDLRGTIGGSSWATAQRWMELPDADMPPSVWRRVRDGYHGGRVAVMRPVSHGVGSHWDLGSAYPWAAASTSLPVGDIEELGGQLARQALASGRPGMYACKVHVPLMHVPPLPWRWRGGTAYPVGDVSGVWPLVELQAALERGCRIDGVSWCIAWREERPVLADIMARWMEVRFAAEPDSSWRAWMRLFANSLTGKLAESPDRRFVRLNPPLADVIPCRGVSPCSPLRCRGACGAYSQLDTWGRMWSVPYWRPSKSGYLHWAAYITAATRVAWMQGAESQGEDMCYGDTDSVWSMSPDGPSPMGNGLGQWSRKHDFAELHVAAPKSYAFVHADTGEFVTRTAGARLTRSDWIAGEAAQERGVMSLVEAAKSQSDNGKGKLFRLKTHKWTMPQAGRNTGWYGDRLIDATTGLTHAVTCDVLKQRQRQQTR
jgi:hypothetical protein